MKKSLINYRKIVDYYLKYTLIIDFFIISIIWVINSNFHFFDFKYLTKEKHIDLITNILSVSISLAGFILACLTIISAIYSRTNNKTPKQAENPKELFFSSGIYNQIVDVFKNSIIELTLCFVIAFIIIFSAENLNNMILFKSLIILMYLLSASTIRSLFILFLLIKIDKY